MTIEIIVYSCLSLVSFSLALGYIIKCRINKNATDNVTDYIPRPSSIDIIVQQETTAAL